MASRFEGPQPNHHEHNVQGGQKACPEERGIEIRGGWIEQIRRRAAGREQHRNHDGKKQSAQQRVATAGAQKRGRKDHSHGTEADCSEQKQQAQPKHVRHDAGGKERREQRREQQFHQEHDSCGRHKLARVDRRAGNRGQQKRADGLAFPFTVKGARQGHGAREQDRDPQDAGDRVGANRGFLP